MPKCMHARAWNAGLPRPDESDRVVIQILHLINTDLPINSTSAFFWKILEHFMPADFHLAPKYMPDQFLFPVIFSTDTP
jgi:hypothetical protein